MGFVGTTNFNVAEVILDNTGGIRARSGYINGTLAASDNLSEDYTGLSPTTFDVGTMEPLNLNHMLNGDIAELLIYSRPLSGAEESQVNTYLENKYGIAMTSVANEVVYREVFPNDLVADIPIDTVGWNMHHDATGEAYDGSSVGGGVGEWSCSARAEHGKPANLPGVNSNPHIPETDGGCLAFSKDGEEGTHNVLVWTEEVAAANVAKDELAAISWYEANTGPQGDVTEMRLALKIADGWYVTDRTFIASIYDPAGMPVGTKMSVTDFSSANWDSLTFIPGTDLSRSGFVPPLRLPGDATLDGVVDEEDAAILAANWLTASGASWGDGDFNDDGAVNDLDATLMAANWGATGSLGSRESLESLVSLPDGVVQAAGIYMDDMLYDSGIHRIDTFEIQKIIPDGSAVPEPATIMLLLSGLLVGFLLRYRRAA